MKVEERLNQLVELGYGKTLIVMTLKAENYKDVDKLNIPSKAASTNDAEAIMKMVIELESSKLNNKQKAAKIAAHGLCTDKTAYHIMSLMKYVEAYHALKS